MLAKIPQTLYTVKQQNLKKILTKKKCKINEMIFFSILTFPSSENSKGSLDAFS